MRFHQEVFAEDVRHSDSNGIGRSSMQMDDTSSLWCRDFRPAYVALTLAPTRVPRERLVRSMVSCYEVLVKSEFRFIFSHATGDINRQCNLVVTGGVTLACITDQVWDHVCECRAMMFSRQCL